MTSQSANTHLIFDIWQLTSTASCGRWSRGSGDSQGSIGISTVQDLRNNFPPPNPTACPATSFTGNPLLTFEPVTDEFVLKIINSASAKSCEPHPIPTTLLYENLDILCRPSSTHLLPLALFHVIWRQPSSNLCWKSHHLTKIFWKTTAPFLTFHFCPKSLSWISAQ